MLAAPAVASAGGLVGDLVNGVDATVDELIGGEAGTGGAEGGSPAPAPVTQAQAETHAQPQPASDPRAGSPPAYTPPAHGTDPHATGTGVIVDVTPSDQEPLPYDSGGGSEDVVFGSSHGSADSEGNYHGHVTILTLLGVELIEGADTDEGETSTGPFGDLNVLLGDICTNSGDQLCLSLLDVNSQTTDNGSSNSFDLATARIGSTQNPLVTAGAVQTTGSVGDDGQCQTSSSTSQVADANVAGVTADVINASSESRACNDGSTSQTNGGNVISVGGTGVPLPQPGCESGAPNTVFEVPLLLEVVCNADDSGGSQISVGAYGVREGLAVFPLTLLGNPAKVVTAAAESHARAPGDDDGDDDGVPDDQDECPSEPGSASNNGCPPGDGGGNGGGNGGGGGGNGAGGGGDGAGDRDDDGVLNAGDECPSVPGEPANDGCPIGDSDGDGVLNDEDACPLVPGPASNEGCPLGPGGDGPRGKGPDTLAFTGADVGLLAAIGFGVFTSGLALMALADRRRRVRKLAR
jgi:hypothetical protein